MKTLYLATLFSFLIFGTLGCKEKNTTDNKSELVKNSDVDPLDEIETGQQHFLNSTSYYVMATNGLSLRKEPSLDSERLQTIPKGASLKVTEPTIAEVMTVDYIKGGMVPVEYQGTKGYVYSGYITDFFIPKEPATTEEYLKIASKTKPGITYIQEENGPDFHEGYNGKLSLPGANWPEAFYISKALYGIPDSIEFPNPTGDATESFSQKDKEKDVWSSDLYVSRKASKLDTIEYDYRAEGFGWRLKIYKKGNDTMEVYHLVFVD